MDFDQATVNGVNSNKMWPKVTVRGQRFSKLKNPYDTAAAKKSDHAGMNCFLAV